MKVKNVVVTGDPSFMYGQRLQFLWEAMASHVDSLDTIACSETALIKRKALQKKIAHIVLKKACSQLAFIRVEKHLL